MGLIWAFMCTVGICWVGFLTVMFPLRHKLHLTQVHRSKTRAEHARLTGSGRTGREKAPRSEFRRCGEVEKSPGMQVQHKHDLSRNNRLQVGPCLRDN